MGRKWVEMDKRPFCGAPICRQDWMGAIVDEPAGESAAYDRAEQGEGSALELAEGAVCGQTCLQVQQGVELLQVAGDEQLSYLFSLRLGVAGCHWRL